MAPLARSVPNSKRRIIRGAMNERYFLTCKKCAQPIWLPLPIAREIDPYPQQMWSADGKPRTFLCSECQHADEYERHNVQSCPEDGRSPSRALFDTVYRVELRCAERCGERICGVTAHMLTKASSQQSGLSIVPGWFAKEKTRTVRCLQGHETHLSSPPRT
jgi:hypothetical protein